jgi:hypothetical protein
VNQSDRRISCRPAGRPERPHPGGQASAGEPWVWKSRETAQPGAAYRDEARCAQEPGSPPTVAASRLTTGPFGVNNSYSASNRRLWSSASLSLAKQRWRAPRWSDCPDTWEPEPDSPAAFLDSPRGRPVAGCCPHR